MADPKITFEEVEKVRKQKEENEAKYQAKVQQQVKDTKKVHEQFETRRYTRKAELVQLIRAWREELSEDPEVLKDSTLEKLFRDVEEYAKWDVTATHSTSMNDLEHVKRSILGVKWGTKTEADLVADIFERTKKYLEKNEENMSIKREDKKEEERIAKRQIMAENLHMFLEDQINGFLPPVPDGGHHIKVKDQNIKTLSWWDGLWDYRDRPLFPHDPTPGDISQGALGDCYMVAVLANVAGSDPDKIKEAVRDNGDGTVTVRLFKRVPTKVYPPIETEKDKLEPYYVTVEKTAPMIHGGLNCLWVAMIEKALVASGMAVDRKYKGFYGQPVPENIDELYEKYKDMPQTLRPTKEECPWLYDEDNNFVKWQPDYEHIEGGWSVEFGETFLGEGYEGYKMDLDNIRKVAGKDIAYDYMMTLLERESHKSFVDQARKLLDAQESADKRMENAYKLFKAVKSGEIRPRSLVLELGENGLLKGLDKLKPDKSYQYFAQAIDTTITNLLYNSNIDDKSTNDFLSQIHEGVKKQLEEARFNSKEESNVQELLKDFEEDISYIAEGISGRYPVSYLKRYEEIRKEIEEGHIVGVSSPYDEKGDRNADGGINYQHAYNVLGVTEEEINGKAYKFIIVRNPHGTDLVPEYDFNRIPPKAVNGRDPKSEGIFKMELSHFMSHMASVNFNGKNLTKEQNREVQQKRKEVAFQSHVAPYSRLFAIIDKDLVEAMKGPNANERVKNLQAKINEFLPGFRKHPNMAKHDIVKDIAKDILKTEQLDPVSKRAVKGTIRLLDLYSKGIQDPMAEISKNISGYSLHKEKSIYDLMDMEGKDELSEVTKLDEEEATKILKILKDVDSKFINSSEQFKNMREQIKQFGVAFANLKQVPGTENKDKYIKSLQNLAKAGKEYLDFKENQRKQPDGSVKYHSDREIKRVEAAQKITEYALTKSRNLLEMIKAEEMRIAEEAERIEQERIERERWEAEREAERKEWERKEAERKERERIEQERKEAERKERERIDEEARKEARERLEKLKAQEKEEEEEFDWATALEEANEMIDEMEDDGISM